MLRDLLFFSTRDRRSIVVLTLLAVICATTLFIVKGNRQEAATVSGETVADSGTTVVRKDTIVRQKPVKAKPEPRYRQWEPQAESTPQRLYPEKFDRLTVIDPNTADTLTLRRIPGIGRWTAHRIVELRDKLGGFHSVSQLLEARHFPAETLEWFAIDTATVAIRKINLNEASFQQLNAHPYISYEQTKELLGHIRLYGRIADHDALRQTGIFTAEETERLQPYLEF